MNHVKPDLGEGRPRCEYDRIGGETEDVAVDIVAVVVETESVREGERINKGNITHDFRRGAASFHRIAHHRP